MFETKFSDVDVSSPSRPAPPFHSFFCFALFEINESILRRKMEVVLESLSDFN